MSRFFDGGTAADSISFNIGNAPTQMGPITVAVLAHASSVASWTGWLIHGAENGVNASWGLLTTSGGMYTEDDFNGGPALSTGWCWYVFTKNSGAATVRWHVHDLTAGTSWTHSNETGTVTSPTPAANGILIGCNTSANPALSFRGRIAAAAAWSTILSDLAVEAACTLTATDLAAATPNWGVLLNQGSTATAVTDFTGGGGGQAALSGTAVDGDEPPGWSYSITPPAVSPRRPVAPTGAVHRAATY